MDKILQIISVIIADPSAYIFYIFAFLLVLTGVVAESKQLDAIDKDDK